jgi:hypothetical protein
LLVLELLREGRAACVAASALRPQTPVAVDVPLASVSWVCLPGEAPTAVGLLSESRSAAFAARSIEPSTDFTSLTLIDASLALPASKEHGPLHARAGAASIKGLAPFGRPSNLRAPVRAALLGITSGLTAALVGFVVIAWSIGARAPALGIGLSGPAAALLIFSALERQPNPLAAYAGVPIAALAGPILSVLFARAGRLIAARGRGWYQ